MKKRFWVLLCLLLLLAGCSADQQAAPAETAPQPAAAAITEPVPAADESEPYLRYTVQDLPGGILRAMGQCVVGARIYVGGQTMDGVALAWTDLEGSDVTVELPPEIEFIFALCPTEDGFALLGGTPPAMYQNWSGDLVSTKELEGRLWLVRYNQEGVQTGVTALQETYTDSRMIFLQAAAGADAYYLLCQNLILKIGSDGAELGRIEVESPDDHMFQSMALSGGELYALTGPIFSPLDQEEPSLWLLALDPDSLEIQTRLALPCQLLSGFGLTQEGGLLLNYTAEGRNELGTLDPSTGGLTCVYDWQALGVAISADSIFQWDQGYVFFNRYGEQLEQLRWTDGPRPEPIILRMAVTGNNHMNLLVREFNLLQGAYRVEMTVYDDHTQDGKPLDVLRTEILAENAPDLYCLCDYGAGGGLCTGGVDLSKVCTDLTPYLDGDAVYGREAFLPSLLAGMEQDGRLYSLPLAFHIVTVTAPSNLIAAPGITMEELETALEQAGPDCRTFPGWMTPQNLLGWTAAFTAGAFVDQDTCRFDGQAFQDYLLWCQTWGRTDVPQSGELYLGDPDERVLLECALIHSTSEVVYAPQRAEARGYEITYAGMPVGVGNGSMFQLAVEIGISSQSAHGEGAWQFIRFCLDHQKDETLYGMPVLQDVIDNQIAQYQRGEDAVSQAEVDKFYDLLNGITVVGGSDEALLSIIKEEADYYFDGQRTAAETAQIVQNRASLYLAEKYG